VTGYQVLLTADAARDLEQIYDYIAEHDLPRKADQVLDRIEAIIDGLRSSPTRGSVPKELRSIGLRDFREVYFKPYRIIYRVIDPVVYVLVIADGRRDLQNLLSRRLLQG
jgi:toxin ParE1/3/4